ncbi:MAG: retron St85 family RNA-directed DNA polymerase [Sphingomicrobium sp.]
MLLEEVSVLTGTSVPRLQDFANVAGKMYKVYPIRKRSGGERIIEQPTKSIKALQRIISNVLFSNFELHPSCLGYRSGTGIADVARLHEAYRFTLRVDFKDFFWAFTEQAINEFLERAKVGLTPDDIAFVGKLTTRNGRLTMGAPSSPIITNVLLFDLDRRFADLATELGCVYTRYADDLLFSSKLPSILEGLLERLISIVAQWETPRLTINHDKTTFLSRKYRRLVVGLTITPEGKTSVGRGRKRRVRALIHRAVLGTLEQTEIGSLRGELAWVNSVEPSFIEALVRKYGHANIAALAPFIAPQP